MKTARERVLVGFSIAAAGSSCLILSAIVAVVLVEAWPALTELGVWRFVSDPSWSPRSGAYNMLPMVVGTCLAALLATLVAAAFGTASAIFVCFYAPPLIGKAYERLLEVMAGLPSVVYGFWGLIVLVPAINSLHPPGSSLLAATVVLALMILPTTTLLTASSFRSVPAEYIGAARALGISRWSTAVFIVLPAARAGIAAGLVLAAGRALGETMAVMMVAGNIVQVPGSLFDPVRTLTANIGLEFGYAMDLHRSVLFVSSLTLTVTVCCLLLLSQVIRSAGRHG